MCVMALHADIEGTTLDTPSPVLSAVVVVGREPHGWTVTTADVEGGIPVGLPAWPSTTPDTETMEACALEPPAPVFVVVLMIRDETTHGVVGGAAVCEVSIHVVDPTGPVLVSLRGADVGEERAETAILISVVVERAETTHEGVTIGVPVNVAIHVVDPASPPVASDSDPGLVRPLHTSVVLVSALNLARALLGSTLGSLRATFMVLGCLLTCPGLGSSFPDSSLVGLFPASGLSGSFFPDILGLSFAGTSLALPLAFEFVLPVTTTIDARAEMILGSSVQNLVAETGQDCTAFFVADVDASEHTLHHFALLECFQLTRLDLAAVNIAPDGVAPFHYSTVALLLQVSPDSDGVLHGLLGLDHPATHCALVLNGAMVLQVS